MRIAEEYERCGAYLDAATRKPLLAALESTLVARHFGALLERGFSQLMDGQRVEDLSRLYSLAGRVGGHDALKGSLREYIKSTGLQIVKDEEKVGGIRCRSGAWVHSSRAQQGMLGG